MRIRDRFSIILLDMNSTFMFGEDRFGPEQNFFETYLRLGGGNLSSQEVNAAVRSCFEGMLRDYRDPDRFDSFPSLEEGLKVYGGLPSLPPWELSRLVEVFGEHEIGHIPDDFAAYLRKLARSHELALVSNIWAPKSRWLREFERAGIGHIFKKPVFSSDFRSIKPSPVLFREALAASQASASKVLCMGDNLQRDIEPAKQLGLATAWINPKVSRSSANEACADYVIPSLLALDEEAG